MTTTTLSKAINEHFALLEKYTSVLVKVHGNTHPELTLVRDIFVKINSKVQENGIDDVDLSIEFNELRSVTNHYSFPSDGCETYAATYQMLESADKAYHS